MLLQQLLERNKRYLYQALHTQKIKKRGVFHNNFLIKNNTQYSLAQQNPQSDRFFNIDPHRKSNLLRSSKRNRQVKKDQEIGINGQKFVINNQKIQKRNGSGVEEQHKQNKSQNKSKDKLNNVNNKDSKKYYQTTKEFFKRSDSQREKLIKRKAFTSQKRQRAFNNNNGGSNNKNRIQYKIMNLPDTFRIKSPFKSSGINSTFIKYQQPNKGKRSQSIHSRQKLLINNERFKNKRSKSHHSFYQNQEQSLIQLSQRIQQNKINKISQSQKQFHIEIQKIEPVQKPKKKNDYVNIFYEYRMNKVKIEKQEEYTPWKKNNNKGKREIDLSELYHLNQ